MKPFTNSKFQTKRILCEPHIASGFHLLFFVSMSVCLAGINCSTAFGQRLPKRGKPATVRIQQDKTKTKTSRKNPFDGDAAYKTLVEICKLGPRISGTEAMAKQQKMLTTRFEKIGAKVERQEFVVKHPIHRTDVKLANLIVQFHPEQKKRIFICTHYDTRPLPDRDLKNPRGLFLGANDGASGCGLLLELANHMKDMDGPLGIDFVFFDAEEFVYQRPRDPLFVGSTYFANQYVKEKGSPRYEFGILIDMIGDKNLDLYWEKNSYKFAQTLTRSIWQTAQELKVKEFVPKVRHEIRDDHLPLNMIAKIPTCDIIDFDYPTIRKQNAYWHTRMDTPDKCSGESMAKVGWVLIEFIKKVQNEAKRRDAERRKSSNNEPRANPSIQSFKGH